MRRKISLLLIMLLSIGILLTGCGSSDDETFKVGLECAYAPFNLDPNG